MLVGLVFPASTSPGWAVEAGEARTALEKEVVATLGFPVQMITWGLSAPEFRFPKFNNSKVSVNKHTKMLTHNYLR